MSHPEPPETTPVNSPAPDPRRPAVLKALERYWLVNVRIMAVLIAVWAFVSLGCGVLWADWLNTLTFNGKPVRLGGFPLGFWFAQQGSILVFILLTLIYAVSLGRLDRRHHQEIERISRAPRD